MIAQKRVAIFARVSTQEEGRSPETQRVAPRAHAKCRGFVTVGEDVEYASGVHEDRRQYRALVAAAKKHRIDAALVWRSDRVAGSIQTLVNALKELRSLGEAFISFQKNIPTTTPPGELIFRVMASIAPSDRALISARVKPVWSIPQRSSSAPRVHQHSSGLKPVSLNYMGRKTRFTRSAFVCPFATVRRGSMAGGARKPSMTGVLWQRSRRSARCPPSKCRLPCRR